MSSDTHTLVGALAGFELDRADSAMEAALALRSLKRSVEEVLLRSLDELGERYGTDSAPWAFAARWADGWLRRAQRLAPPVHRLAVLVGDATRSELDRDALAARAFELFCGRSGRAGGGAAGARVAGLSDVVESLSPDAVVIVGGHLADEVALWAYRVRAAVGPLPMALFRRAGRASKLRTTATPILPDTPFAAPELKRACLEALARGTISDESRRWLAARGPLELVGRGRGRL